MKKNYSAPNIAFQTLNVQTLSGGCYYDVASNQAKFQCPIKDPAFDGETIFIEGASCDFKGDADKVCYAIPTADANVYNS